MAETNAIFAVGRRKTAIARVKLMPGTGKVTINNREVDNFFTVARIRQTALDGLNLTGTTEKFDLKIRVSGGGITGQAGAVRLGISRALQKHTPELRPDLKKAGFLRRDPRMVERKKYGLHKARRGTQFSKR